MYIVAYLSLFDGELTQTVVDADSPYSAAVKVLGFDKLAADEMAEILERYSTLDSLLDDYCPNTDSYMSIYSLKTGEIY
jgi:hypothetical protein